MVAILPAGDALLANSSVLLSVYGHHIVHQTMGVEDDRLLSPNSWTAHHPRALHVRWSDADNRALVAARYPHLLAMYDSLFLTVQKTDVARLLYLHAFGGLYADADYECGGNLFHLLEQGTDIQIVRSPILLNEVFQNSLMFARHRHLPFFRQALETILEIHAFLHTGCTLSASCSLLRLFGNPFTVRIANVAITQYFTGPAALDKTLVLNPHLHTDLSPLPVEGFFYGPYAWHRHANSWVTIWSSLLPIGGAFGIFCLLLFVAVALSCHVENRRARERNEYR